MISIPDPCKEDFSQMTPTERGAFCDKCSIDTFDFRSLSNQQINQIVKENANQHICGRFNKSQLIELNAGFLEWKNQQPRVFQSKFILACIMVFGLSLFSCENEEAIQDLNQIEVVQDNTTKAKFINTDLEISQVDLLDYIQEQIVEPGIAEFVCEIKDYELGGVIYEEYDVQQIYETRGEIQVAGGIGYTENYIKYVEEVVPEDTTSILADPIHIDSRIFEATAYPNPTQGLSTIALDIEQEGQFDVVLYNMNGQLVQTIHSGVLQEGRKQFECDLSDKNSGLYIVKINSQGQNETLKISKVN